MSGFGGIGAGGGAAATPNVDVINVQQPGLSITGAGFLTVASFTLAGGLLSTANLIRILARMRQTTGSGNVAPRLSYGGSVVALGSSIGVDRGVLGWLNANGATNAQRATVGCWFRSAQYGEGSAAVDSTASQTLLLEVDLATDTDVLVCDYFQAVIERAP